MSRLRTLLTFFAAVPEQQIAALGDLPRDRGAPDFFVSLQRNPLLTLVRGLCDEAAHHDWEPWEDFLERTQLPEEGGGGALSELLCYAWLLLQSPEAESYWTQKALERKTEWKLFRRLAGQALAELGWAGELPQGPLADAVQRGWIRPAASAIGTPTRIPVISLSDLLQEIQRDRSDR